MKIEEPRKFSHINSNLKKEELNELSMREIERENKVLLEKMENIHLNKQDKQQRYASVMDQKFSELSEKYNSNVQTYHDMYSSA
jgi:hypothetical protein